MKGIDTMTESQEFCRYRNDLMDKESFLARRPGYSDYKCNSIDEVFRRMEERRQEKLRLQLIDKKDRD